VSEPADRVRTLLLRADNVLKNEGDEADRERRALDALNEALEIAQDPSVDERVRELVQRRLTALSGREVA
jgi:predicted secreted Zn-dependent protease